MIVALTLTIPVFIHRENSLWVNQLHKNKIHGLGAGWAAYWMFNRAVLAQAKIIVRGSVGGACAGSK